MRISRLFGIKPSFYTFKSSLPIDEIRTIFLNATDKNFRYFTREKTKHFYGSYEENVFILKQYTNYRNTFKAQIIISLFEEENGTKIEIKIYLKGFVIGLMTVMITFGFFILIRGIVKWFNGQEYEEIMFFGAMYIIFPWLGLKMGYLMSLDHSNKALYEILKKLKIKNEHKSNIKWKTRSLNQLK